MKKKKNIIIAIIFSILFLIVIKDIYKYEITSYDKLSIDIFKHLRSNGMTCFMSIMTGFGSFLFVVSILLVLLLLYKNKDTVCYLIINTVIIFFTNDFVKFLVKRPRPVDSLINENNYSFPSSHAMVSTLLYGFLIYLIYKNISNKKIKYLLISLLVLIVVLICISRIYLGVHYLSDVIGGVSLSIIYIMIFLTVNKDFEKKV